MLIAGPEHKRPRGKERIKHLICLVIAAIVAISSAHAQDVLARYDFRIDAVTLGAAIDELQEETGVRFWYDYDLATTTGINSVIGQYTVEEAMEIMLRETDLSGGLTESGMIVISQKHSANAHDREDEMASGKLKKGLLAGVSAFLFGAGGQSLAQSNDEGASVRTVDTIIVTANRREQALEDVPISIVALSDDELDAKNISSLVDLSVAVPGLFISDNGGFRDIQMRGLGGFSGTPFVGVYVDEMPVTSLTATSQIDTRLYDLQRVEVLRGPQGTLYGNGAIAGALRFITKKPDLDDFSGGATIGVSHTNDGGTNHNSTGFLNVPIVEDKFAFRGK